MAGHPRPGAGLGGLTVFLEEGQREQWFSSELIRYMALVTLFGFALLFVGQVRARRPIIKLSLLLDRQFGAVAMMGVVLGIVLYGTSYAIPQFLATVADYNALQSGKIVLLSGIPSLIMIAMTPYLLRHIDIRIAVGFGLTIMGVSALLDTTLTWCRTDRASSTRSCCAASARSWACCSSARRRSARSRRRMRATRPPVQRDAQPGRQLRRARRHRDHPGHAHVLPLAPDSRRR